MIENCDSHKQTKDTNFVADVIRDNNLNGKRISNRIHFFFGVYAKQYFYLTFDINVHERMLF